MKPFKEYIIGDQPYRVSTILVWIVGCILLGLGLWSVSLSQGRYYAFASCPAGGDVCFNKFYNSNLCNNYSSNTAPVLDPSSDVCSIKVIPAGSSVGSRPPFIVEYFITIAIVLFFVGLLLNHFLFNKGFKFKGGFDE